jgi:hypothetical protein
MSDHGDEILPIELRSIAERLHGDRYEASPLELDRIKKRAMAQASSRSAGNPHKGMFMRSKLLGIALTVGLLLSTASVGLAVTGNFPSTGSSSSSKSSTRQAAAPNASSSQYAGSEQCKTLRAENRADEKELRASDKKSLKGLKGRERRQVKAEQKSRRKAFQLRNRREERRCNRTGVA